MLVSFLSDFPLGIWNIPALLEDFFVSPQETYKQIGLAVWEILILGPKGQIALLFIM